LNSAYAVFIFFFPNECFNLVEINDGLQRNYFTQSKENLFVGTYQLLSVTTYHEHIFKTMLCGQFSISVIRRAPHKSIIIYCFIFIYFTVLTAILQRYYNTQQKYNIKTFYYDKNI